MEHDSDPYLKVTLGKKALDNRNDYVDNEPNPEIFKCFEFSAKLPGVSQLVVKAMDYDLLSYDDLIGQTTIDLEDRWFDERWKNFGHFGALDGKKAAEFSVLPRFRLMPTERRPLYAPLSQHPQGELECFLEMMTAQENATYRPFDIALPPEQEFELRVIIWKTEDVVPDDTWEEMNDMYVVLIAQTRGWEDRVAYLFH